MKNKLGFENFNISDILGLPSATLAFIGDAVYTLYAREYELQFYHGKPLKLHRAVVQRVNANAQAIALEKLLEHLTIEEMEVVRRAKNCNTATRSKNFGIADYKKSTAFEALIGYLYLKGENERLKFIVELVFKENTK